ncbi:MULTISPECIES: serine hydrolase [unclassified Rathayibacter]|uniref:serine hydrolase domain-containing protein n=1 Tax=unclassified Rathayibacter TaxID=2609250 RepID=UPI000F4B5331|nr:MULTISPECIES: serine hydrolase [unclassified Rathayibacter]ROP56984.1 CubicO group peptidase (beta-lactamase class C family) [Rathayibacter sp. PhB186]ROS55369.1 CubicO group peptidase (beta-lactamase class C family) [Rathayibacter sp. PhB185]TDX81046.1 CubicO group peptidase (beta-lactamase class C family) [Rathayibacter sp. PhB151]
MTAAQIFRDRLVEHIDAVGFGAHGLHVLIGDDTAEHRWTPDVREDVHSVAKGVCVLATGLAVDEGLISLDEPLGSLTADVTADLGEGVAELTLRRLLSMTSGIDLPWSPTLMTDWPDLAVEFLRRPSAGPVFQYSNASSYTAMRLLETRVGDVGEYVDRRLLRPLGIEGAEWERCPNGRIVAGSGLALRTEETARIGRLIRDRGVWRGERILAPEWSDLMHSEWVAAGTGPGYRHYALAGWDGPGASWRLHGAYGQLLVFAGDAVVTISADDHPGADAIAAFIAAERAAAQH